MARFALVARKPAGFRTPGRRQQLDEVFVAIRAIEMPAGRRRMDGRKNKMDRGNDPANEREIEKGFGRGVHLMAVTVDFGRECIPKKDNGGTRGAAVLRFVLKTNRSISSLR